MKKDVEMAVETIELQEITEENNLGSQIIEGSGIELIKNVKVELEVYVGSTEITIGELYDLKENSIVKLDRDVTETLDIVLDGKVVAKGMLTAVDDNFGIRIIDVSK